MKKMQQYLSKMTDDIAEEGEEEGKGKKRYVPKEGDDSEEDGEDGQDEYELDDFTVP